MTPQLRRICFWPDTHAPFHDKLAVACALRIAKDFNPDELVFVGDFFDCYSVSRFDKDPSKTFSLLKDEIGPGIELLKKIHTTIQPKKTVFLMGNHEQRIISYANRSASRLSYLVNAANILEIPEGWTFLPYEQAGGYRIGSLLVRHKTYQNQHVCHKSLQRSGVSLLFGHTHRVQMASVKTLDGKTHFAYSIGWLGDEKKAAEYMDISPDWAHAIALGYFLGNNHQIEIIGIKNGRAIYHGKAY
jgi:UDP-2,3-diacylglucosamine pyrophosphatase LpxH